MDNGELLQKSKRMLKRLATIDDNQLTNKRV